MPVRGARGAGCQNHLDNLETLCHAHHVIETRLQIVSERQKRDASGGHLRTIACWEGLHDRCWSKGEFGTLAPLGWPMFLCMCGCHPGAKEIQTQALG